MLEERYGAVLGDILLAPGSYELIPEVVDPDAVAAVPAELKARVIRSGEQYAGFEWPVLPASAYLEFQRSGDRRPYEKPSGERREALAALALAELTEGRGRFVDDIADGVWAICEESTWVVPAHNYVRLGVFPTRLADPERPDIDLFAGETAALLAWVSHLHGAALDGIDPIISRRIDSEVHRRVIDPYLDRSDFWWMWLTKTPGHHVNNWTPWCTSTCLSAALLLERNRDRQLLAVRKALRIIDVFLDHYAARGGCEEGPSYWTHAAGSLLDCLESLHSATGGAIDVFEEEKIRNMGCYLHRVHIGGDRFVNFADAPARIEHDWSVLMRYAMKTGCPELRRMAEELRGSRGGAGRCASLERGIRKLFLEAESPIQREPQPPPDAGGFGFEGIQVMTARQAPGSERGFFLAAKGGHNDESHNHNDVGHFVVYYDTHAVLLDPGVPTYTAATFDPARRYTLWPMRSSYHNVPMVAGFEQTPGVEARADAVVCILTAEEARFEAELSGAYPPEAGIASLRRQISLHRGADARVEWIDRFELRAGAIITEVMMVQERPSIRGGTVLIRGPERRTLELVLPDSVSVRVERIELSDERLSAVWGPFLHRVLVESAAAVSEATWRFSMSPQGAS